MICDDALEHLGPLLDGELPPAERDDLVAHLATCRSCAKELNELRAMADELAVPPDVHIPEGLWAAIEQRLDVGGPSGAARHARGVPARHRWLRRVPLALAAAVVLAVGLSVFGPAWNQGSARASTVDFRGLLDALPLDAQRAFRKFLVLYNAKESSAIEAKRYAPDLHFDVPDVLPGGFRLESVYVLQFGRRPGVAATYDRDGDFLAAVFHPPVQKENFGPHRDYPCVVGRHEGLKVSVGEWRLVHVMEPTTCHCVLSKLDEETELPAIMAVVAPGAPVGNGSHRH
ncbi:MAG: anti-sigma factor family protein [Phycisphaerae bacterium]